MRYSLKFPVHSRIAAALSAAVLLQVAGSLLADVDSARGEALYENHCSTCHDRNVHKRDDHQVQSMPELRTWVQSMSTHTGLDWQNEDIEDVAFYLNLRLYRFDSKP